jgi:hypothetical protein
MSAAGKANTNKWMVDLATSAKQGVDAWPTWKKENMGVVAPSSPGKTGNADAKSAQLPKKKI